MASNKEKFELITSSPVEEVLTEEDLKAALDKRIPLTHYIGFEISGFLHLGTGIMTALKIKDLQKANIECSIFLADFHSWINNKLGGDLKTIQKIAGGYYKEGFKQCLKVVGARPDKIKFILGSQLYNQHKAEFLKVLIDISKNLTLSRVQKSLPIMGRKAGGETNFGMLVYPPMQVADIFIQGINMAHAGMDQRKAHVIAREVAPKLVSHPLTGKFNVNGKEVVRKYKPIAIHHHLLLGLQKPPMWPIPKDKLQELWSSMKMSKSIPSSAVFIHDSPEQVKLKLMKAFCPAKEVEFNPVLDWAKHIIFKLDKKFVVKRDKKYGGNLTFKSFDELAGVFAAGKLHPVDLKAAVADWLGLFLRPIHTHFSKGPAGKMLEELNKLKITR